jgi:hypothetical protein
MAVRAGPAGSDHYHRFRWPTDLARELICRDKTPWNGIRLLLDADRSTRALMANLPKKPALDMVPTARSGRGSS